MWEKASCRLQHKPFSSENKEEVVSEPAKGKGSDQRQQKENKCLHKLPQGRQGNQIGLRAVAAKLALPGVVGLVSEPDEDGNLAATFRGQRRPRILK